MNRLMRNNRGIALLIVLLVMALLIALVFEFAYGTRVSLRAAMNYRDSQRAYYLARSGIGYVWWNLVNMPDNLVHGEWQVVPIVSAGDTEVRVYWEDEGGKINISEVRQNDNKLYNWLSQLFTDLGIDQDVLSQMGDDNFKRFSLLSELHQIMRDDDFIKISNYLTVHSKLDKKVNINTTSSEVLISLFRYTGEDERLVEEIVERRKESPFESATDLTQRIVNIDVNYGNEYFDFSRVSSFLRIYSYVTVGDYVKQIQAVIQNKGGAGFSILYWRVL